jgi:hypothetical protein
MKLRPSWFVAEARSSSEPVRDIPRNTPAHVKTKCHYLIKKLGNLNLHIHAYITDNELYSYVIHSYVFEKVDPKEKFHSEYNKCCRPERGHMKLQYLVNYSLHLITEYYVETVRPLIEKARDGLFLSCLVRHCTNRTIFLPCCPGLFP